MKIALDAKSKAWLKINEKELPKMSAGKKGLRYVGTLNNLDEISNNPRRGSDVYVGHEFTITTAQTKFSEVPGAPTMPIKQWTAYRPIDKPKCLYCQSHAGFASITQREIDHCSLKAKYACTRLTPAFCKRAEV